MSRSFQARVLKTCLQVGVVGVVGCSDGTARVEPESDSFRLGRVHVILEPKAAPVAGFEAPADDNQLEVSARFAVVRGLDEDFARARIGMPLLAQELLQPSDCGLSDQLVAGPGESGESTDMRELVLVDAGDLSLRIGSADFDVPLALVPDLLPYMSGVEYLGEDETLSLPSAATPSLTVRARGSQTDELPAFLASGQVPRAPGLSTVESDVYEQRRGAVILRWTPGDDEFITVRLLPVRGGEPVGPELTCVLPDRGVARLDLDRLRSLGLPDEAEALQAIASRTQITAFEAGDFAAAELVVERRDRLVLPLLRGR